MSPQQISSDNLRGILLMIGAMACFALEDMFVKWAAVGLPTGQILLFLGFLGAPVFAALAARRGSSFFSATFWNPAVMARNAGEMIGTWGFITALAVMPLATISAIIQAMPLAVTFGAAVFLRETVGWRRWSAIGIGFVGVVIVVRPGADGFTTDAFWGLLAVAGLSARDLATRSVPTRISTFLLAAWGFATAGVLGAGMLAVSGGAVMPDPAQAGFLVGALTFGIAGYWAITAAMRVGEVASVTPFRYARLLFGLIIGWLVFAEPLQSATIIGSVLIIGSGLYSFARERRLRQRALPIGGNAS
ncbi:MAG: DMT family transporter [Paracoccaceae bacterium]|nr:DMT family transporter [Paracoccaceae bacterium]